MHIVDKNYIALFDHGIKMLVTYQLYILDPRFVSRLSKSLNKNDKNDEDDKDDENDKKEEKQEPVLFRR